MNATIPGVTSAHARHMKAKHECLGPIPYNEPVLPQLAH